MHIVGWSLLYGYPAKKYCSLASREQEQEQEQFAILRDLPSDVPLKFIEQAAKDAWNL